MTTTASRSRRSAVRALRRTEQAAALRELEVAEAQARSLGARIDAAERELEQLTAAGHGPADGAVILAASLATTMLARQNADDRLRALGRRLAALRDQLDAAENRVEVARQAVADATRALRRSAELLRD